MHKIASPLRLVSFATKKHEESLFCQLSKLNEDVSIINSYNWLKRRITDPKGLFVLVLPVTDISVDEIINAISATSKSRYLVIFFPPITDKISLVLNACDDCCIWACDQMELTFRLNRILLTHKESICSSGTHIENKVWADLNLIGNSKVFRDILSRIKRAANYDVSVLNRRRNGVRQGNGSQSDSLF